MALFTTENTQRVNRQKNSPIYVIISNPPYNARQINENDNNKNRKYPVIDKRVAKHMQKIRKPLIKTRCQIFMSKPFVGLLIGLEMKGIIAYQTIVLLITFPSMV